jgi:DNA-directed RNA polymerase specialized sigma subunit
MTAKQFLNEYRELNKEIGSMCSERVRLQRLAESIGSSLGGSQGKNKQAGAAKFEAAIDKMIVLDEDINRKIDTLIEKRAEIESVIEKIDDTILRTLLRYRYINGYNFERVAVEMNYSWRHMLRLHSTALNKVKQLL